MADISQITIPVGSTTETYDIDAKTVNGHTVEKNVPSNAVFTDNNTTYAFAEGSTDGTFKVTPSGGSAQSVPVHGFQITELVDGTTTSVQHQIVDKTKNFIVEVNVVGGTNKGRALIYDSSGKIAVSDVTSTELGYLDGVTSKIQTQLDAKQASITGGASSITSNNLTASRALVSNSSGKVAVSAVTSTELGYLDGVTSNVQTQLNNKVSKAGDTMTGNLIIEKSAPRLNIDTTNVTLGTNSNNGVTDSTKYQGINVRDSNDGTIGNFEVYATTGGTITTRMYSRNEMTDGTFKTNSIYTSVKKDGTRTITLGDEDCTYSWNSGCPANFRSSIGLGSMALENTSSWQSALSTSTSTTGTNGFNMRKYGNVVTIQGNGIAASARGTVPSGYRPKTKVYVKCLVLGTSNDWYDGCLEIATGGTITVHYINNKSNETTTSSSITVYVLGSWIL